ncbi:MAG: hypothetical protein LQ349_000657 [Xanthoria aureola]|nr:MAG: hypothetical protein LQ349_000657 [Xanthoria aureola]
MIGSTLARTTTYFTVSADDQYAVYPSFQYWTFPHGRLPRGWNFSQPTRLASGPPPAHSNITSAVLARDQVCIISGHKDIMERAHLCPVQETVWFQTNNMSQYNQSLLLVASNTTDDMSNLIALKEDVRTAFDKKRMFAIVAKQGGWMVQFLQPSNSLDPEYHIIKPKLHPEVAPEHILTRFAWAVFPLLRPFLKQGPERKIRVFEKNTDGFGEETETYMDADTIKKLFFPSRKSSKKGNETDDGAPDDGEPAGGRSVHETTTA